MLVEIFCEIDDFCKQIEKNNEIKLLGNRQDRGRKRSLVASEIMTIVVYYHYSGFKCFKHYYQTMIQGFIRDAFSATVSYNRFIELKQKLIIPLWLFIKLHSMDKCNGISIIDSFALKACHTRRESSHRLFKYIAKKGKTSVGWFFGFKLHIVINSRGEIINFHLTTGNVSDNDSSVLEALSKNVFGKLIGDKGYIGAFEQLYKKGIQLIHRLRKNMKNKLMDLFDKQLLAKRGVVESVIGILKESFNIEHSRHRSKLAFLVHIFSALAAYALRPKKPIIFSDMDYNLISA
jgi:Transposase DDE domain